MNKIRSFIAIETPDGIKKDLFEIQEKLKKAGADIGWTRPEGIHFTLKFLGEIEEEKLVNIQKAIEQATKEIPDFILWVGGIGVFPNTKSPRVIWIGIKGEGENLKTLQESIERETEKIGFKKEGRNFSPHLTLGRVRSQKNRDALTKYLEEFEKIELGSFNVKEVLLMKSELRPKGAVYTQLWKATLK